MAAGWMSVGARSDRPESGNTSLGGDGAAPVRVNAPEPPVGAGRAILGPRFNGVVLCLRIGGLSACFHDAGPL